MSHVKVGSITLTLLLPMLLVILSSPIAPTAQAADACAGSTTPVQWNETVQRISHVPFHSNSWWGMWEDMEYEDDEKDTSSGGSTTPDADGSDELNDALHPEEPWMYERTWPLPQLEPLEENLYTTMLIGNDSVGALRVNLSADYRTTVCIKLQDMDLNPVNGDVYLFTTEEYDSYAESYSNSHNQNQWGFEELEESLSEIPPEWRRFNFLGWKSYRDSHQYEDTSEVNFALNLDQPEVYSSFFSGNDWQDFYIVVDMWDNVHDNDAEPVNAITAADVTIVTTERSLILPPYTVALVFLVAFISVLAIPFVMNARYMKAGLETEAPQNIVPSLETAPQVPDHTEPAHTEHEAKVLPSLNPESMDKATEIPPQPRSDEQS
ncbi:MAG: hypothetical protein CMA63_01805 [Euryarchaeota archaeon]|nr:hypothetical protein [Euryarchaeota archaeon]|tara:strand:+ start:10772 stop:11908 length:1137 start_codon:yes stop_codon:yes gene_type:complete